MFIETKEWKELHDNGSVWIVGKVALVADLWKHLYDIRYGFKGFEGKPVCRIGFWIKYFDNGQIAWTLDFGDGSFDYKSKEKFPSYRKDGSLIIF